MTHSFSKPPTDPPSQSQPYPQEVGYGKPPKHSQFKKGESGNPSGRPKKPIGISIKEILDGDQMGKNGEVISRREAIVIRMMNDALAGNQKAFSLFLKLLEQSGLKRIEERPTVSSIYYDSRQMTPEELETWKRNFGRPMNEPRK